MRCARNSIRPVDWWGCSGGRLLDPESDVTIDEMEKLFVKLS